MKCPKCFHYIRGANKRKIGGQWKHKNCGGRSWIKASKGLRKPIILSQPKEQETFHTEKQENPVKKLFRNIKLRYGWT